MTLLPRAETGCAHAGQMHNDGPLKKQLMDKSSTAITMLLTETAEKHCTGELLAFCLPISEARTTLYSAASSSDLDSNIQ